MSKCLRDLREEELSSYGYRKPVSLPAMPF